MGMTNEEAKKIIIQERDSLKANSAVKVENCLYEAFDTAIKALEQAMWIPVSERLPVVPANRWANFLVTEKVHTLKGDVIEVDVEGFFNGHFQSNTEVIAWMPLPKAYKEAKDE